MIIIKKLRDYLVKKLAPAFYFEIEKFKSKNQNPFLVYKGFKKFGANSFFWGKSHTITGFENFEIGENVHINDNAFIRAEGGVVIGDNTHISRNLVLYSINHDFKGDLIPYNHQMIKKQVIIGKNVWIGTNVCIAPGSIIGDGCIIGMGTTVSGNIPPLSIVASPKCVIIGQRDAEHYNHLENERKYGGIDGTFYNWSPDKTLDKIGDTYESRRSKSELIHFKGRKAIKKTFLNTDDGSRAFRNEIEAYSQFKNYNWCPQLFDQHDNYIIIEYFSSEKRLDKCNNYDTELLEEILWSVLDIFNEGYAHCDLHAKNIFVTENGIKIIDFESMQPQSHVDFFDSYDLTGKGLASPFLTGNMNILNSSYIFSIGNIFKIDTTDKVREVLNKRFKKQMLNSSVTFQSLRNSASRHTLQIKNIYSTFDLDNIKVMAEDAQRNTERRILKFKINSEIIRDKTVLDIGSNIGGTLLALSKFKPQKMLGLEYDNDKVFLANKLAKYNNIRNVEFIEGDIESVSFKNSFNQTFDMVFCLALIEHLKDKHALLAFLSKVCKSSLYFEGNANSDINFITCSLQNAGFRDIQYLGFSDDEKNNLNNTRPLFIAEK